jgi:hypothetical protein
MASLAALSRKRAAVKFTQYGDDRSCLRVDGGTEMDPCGGTA